MPFRGGKRRRRNYNNEKFKRPKVFNSHPNNKQFFSKESLTEKEVGITEYLTDLEGFSGIIKARYSDFHVNEINNSGEIAKLTDISPPDFRQVPVNTSCENTTVLPEETWEKIKQIASREDAEPVEIDASSLTKEERTVIHEHITRIYGGKIIAHTEVKDDKSKIIRFRKHTSNRGVDKRLQWPNGKGVYVYFLLYKEAMDTLEATYKISDCLKMKSGAFTYAGVKDKRAKTTQWFCVKKVAPQTLINKTQFLRNIHIGNITFHDEPLKLGHLKGNRFRVALRNVTANENTINRALESLKTIGFINYYGLQRFGSDKEVPTYKIGIALLRGQWKEACSLILDPKSSEDPGSEIAQAKRVFQETSNSELANKEFSKWYNKCVESKLLIGFNKNHKNDYVNALENIPRNMRLLYIHSFQSFIWNQLVSRRIKEFGMNPIVGDLVLVSEDIVTTADVLDEEEVSNRQEVKVLTEADLGAYSIYDVVLPLPGYDIKYPENIVKTWYKDVLEEHDLSLELPKQKVRTYNISGAYRKILAHVNNLSWKTLRYNHPNDVLIRSDYEELIGNAEPKDNPQGQYTGLVLDFCLDSSCYATMVLREILKIDTSTSQQSKLNDYHADQVPKIIVTTDEDVSSSVTDSLLFNTATYEEFKQQINAIELTTEKHKSEDDAGNNSKKLKTSEEDDSANLV
ncbi:hypothetical protein RN001_003853 [Aquatica leii]|uniref:TRUD domain-containing protein n=1 Tax=Aquatica leii TaxID=1421715 RepID=A0AAN7SL17_9COLE|nr:hypothetical protein RN001_003853 [Aquatica leii]